MTQVKNEASIQKDFNKRNNIIPKTIFKSIDDIMVSTSVADSTKEYDDDSTPLTDLSDISDK